MYDFTLYYSQVPKAPPTRSFQLFHALYDLTSKTMNQLAAIVVNISFLVESIIIYQNGQVQTH
jgi:hypothetical protein